MARYRRKPEEIEAVQFIGSNRKEVAMAMGYEEDDGDFLDDLFTRVKLGNWVVTGGKSCSILSDTMFRAVYEEVT